MTRFFREEMLFRLSLCREQIVSITLPRLTLCSQFLKEKDEKSR